MKISDAIPGVLLIIALFIFSRISSHFLDLSYLLSSSSLYVEIGLLAIGSTFIIATGNIDLSIGSNMILTACLTAKLMAAGCPVPIAVLFAISVGTVLGLLNGVLVAVLGIPSFLATLGTMAAYRGIAQAMMGPASVALPAGFKGIDQHGIANIPIPLILFLISALIGGLVLHRTVFGRWTFATGSNESAARYTGIPITRVKATAFAATGLLAGLAALLLDSRLGVARHDLSLGIELDAITVVVVGGTSIYGGSGSMLGTVLALFLIDVVKTGMGVANVKPEYQLTVTGILLIGAALSMYLAKQIGLKMEAVRKKPSVSLEKEKLA